MVADRRARFHFIVAVATVITRCRHDKNILEVRDVHFLHVRVHRRIAA